MALSWSYCTYRLLFKHPFSTSLGLRDGTDTLYIRVEENGVCGYGEVTLPPYVKETIGGTIARLGSLAEYGFAQPDQLLNRLDTLAVIQGAPGFRTGISTALIDLIGKSLQAPVHKQLDIGGSKQATTLMTIGVCSEMEARARLEELPRSGGLKLKVGDPESRERVAHIMALDHRRLMLDGNQGFATVQDAADLARSVGTRAIGFEQPFAKARYGMNDELAASTDVVVFADESIQDLAELEAEHAHFGGVNLKLMKCGGLDKAKAMSDKARQLGLQVMLGCMSESSLGCTAMAQLATEADIVDLDGPWLIKNDPFRGIAMVNGQLQVPDGPGVGATLVADLEFTPIGA